MAYITRQRLLKIIGWTIGMSLAVAVMLGKGATKREFYAHALIGALIGLVLGILFASRLPPSQ